MIRAVAGAGNPCLQGAATGPWLHLPPRPAATWIGNPGMRVLGISGKDLIKVVQ